jgi:hypothetical protein
MYVSFSLCLSDSLFLSFCPPHPQQWIAIVLSLNFSTCLDVSLYLWLSISLSLYPPVSIPLRISMSRCLSESLCLFISVPLSLFLFFSMSLCLTIYLSILISCLSFHSLAFNLLTLSIISLLILSFSVYFSTTLGFFLFLFSFGFWPSFILLLIILEAIFSKYRKPDNLIV